MSNTIPNLLKACEVLRQLAAEPKGMSQTVIEETVGLPRATAFRILSSFLLEGFVYKVGKIYFLGPALGHMAAKEVTSTKLREIGVSVLHTLAEKTGETAHLAIPSGLHSLILEVCDSPKPIRVASTAGTLADMHCSSTGKVFLAYMEESRQAYALSSLSYRTRTSRTHTGSATLKKELETVAKRGFAVDDEEYHDDVRCLGAPISSPNRGVVAAIGITATTMRFPREIINQVALVVKAAAAEMEEKLASSAGQ